MGLFPMSKKKQKHLEGSEDATVKANFEVKLSPFPN